MDILTVGLIFLVAFMAGCEGVVDSFQFHQPIIACFLVGLVTGHITEGLILGGSLQLIALGWMNIGAAVAPDAALASTISAILVCTKGASPTEGIALAMPLAVAGLVLTIFVRTFTIALIHAADGQGKKGNFRGVEAFHYGALCIQGLRIAIPAMIVLSVPTEVVTAALASIPAWLTGGLGVAGGFVVVVGYAMVINMMATEEVWPFLFLGFALAALSNLTLVAMGMIGICLALVYLRLAPQFNGGGTAGSIAAGDPLDAIINDYE